jgi:hypothetical protein
MTKMREKHMQESKGSVEKRGEKFEQKGVSC